MLDLFTTPSLYADIPHILFCFQYWALKTANESVNEAMGGMVDVHAVGRRHLSQERYVEETYIHWNGPPLTRATPLLQRALDIYFKDMFGGEWHFNHRSFGGQNALLARGNTSEVLARKADQPCKLPLLRGICSCKTCA